MSPFWVQTVATVVTFFITTSSLADSPATTERWEGYRRVDSSEVKALNLPFQQFAENAVFQMITVGGTRTAGEHFDVVDLGEDMNGPGTLIPKETDPAILSDTKNPRPLQIETCRKQGLRYCPVLGYTSNGTAFFNRGNFHTCRHGFHNWISLASQLNGNISVKDISPPMILRASRNGQMTDVYNSATVGKPMMEFSAINDNPRLNYQTFQRNHPSPAVAEPVGKSDYVEMTLNERIVRDSALSTRTSGLDNLQLNEETYLVGYPGQTNVFPGGEGDSPGNTLMISNGHALAPVRPNANLRTTNYSNPGISGGALITASGELVGLHCSGRPDSTNPGNTSTSAYPIDRNLMTQYWNYITYPSDQELPSVDHTQGTTVAN